MTDSTAYRQVGVIGTGRVATAMACALACHSQHPLAMWGRNAARLEQSVATVQSFGLSAASSLKRLAKESDLILIAVSDDAVPEIVQTLSDMELGKGLICHLSGRSGASILNALYSDGRVTAAIHPAMTFTGVPSQEVISLSSTCFAITGSSDIAVEQSKMLVERLGGTAFEVSEADRSLYHAALCHASNHLVTLLSGAFHALEIAGIEAPRQFVAPLVRAALENSLSKGFDALSGPLLRGDRDTIGQHLVAVAGRDPDLLRAYKAMAIATLDEMTRNHQVDPDLRLYDDLTE